MKIFEKNGYLFLSGGYYASEMSEPKKLPPKKRIEEVNKRKQESGDSDLYDMYAVNNKIRTTYCYVKSNEINRELETINSGKKIKSQGVASLGLYAVYCIGLDSSVQNCIVCFNVRDKEYGYVLVKDEMIFPGGEFVSDKEVVKEAVISLIRTHNRSTNVDRHIVDVYLTSELIEIQDSLISQTDINIILLGYDEDKKSFVANSDVIFWGKKAISKYFNRSKFKPLHKTKKQKIMMGVSVGLLVALSTIGGWLLWGGGEEVIKPAPAKPKSGLASGLSLTQACFKNTDQIFNVADQPTTYGWYIYSFKCTPDSLSIVFKPTEKIQLPTVGKDELRKALSENGVIFNNNQYSLTRKLHVYSDYKYRGDSNTLFMVLNEYASSRSGSFDVTSDGINNYTIKSSLSPVYLVNHNLIHDLPIQSIEGKYDPNTAFYSWTINGRIK